MERQECPRYTPKFHGRFINSGCNPDVFDIRHTDVLTWHSSVLPSLFTVGLYENLTLLFAVISLLMFQLLRENSFGVVNDSWVYSDEWWVIVCLHRLATGYRKKSALISLYDNVNWFLVSISWWLRWDYQTSKITQWNYHATSFGYLRNFIPLRQAVAVDVPLKRPIFSRNMKILNTSVLKSERNTQSPPEPPELENMLHSITWLRMMKLNSDVNNSSISI